MATEADITALLVLAVDRVAVVVQALLVLAVAQEILHQHLPLKVATEEQAGRLFLSMLAVVAVVRQQAVVLAMEPLEWQVTAVMGHRLMGRLMQAVGAVVHLHRKVVRLGQVEQAVVAQEVQIMLLLQPQGQQTLAVAVVAVLLEMVLVAQAAPVSSS